LDDHGDAADQSKPPEVVDRPLRERLHHPEDSDQEEHEAEDVGECGVIELQNDDGDHDPQHTQQQLDPPVAGELGEERTQRRVCHRFAHRRAIQPPDNLAHLVNVL
jgi:hypothetical protein